MRRTDLFGVPSTLTLFALAVLPSAFGCGTDAVGIDACRKVEQFRCKSAPYCIDGFSEDDVTSCESFYRDQCLHGLENTSRSPSDGEVDACIDALNQAVNCKLSGAATLASCPDIALVAGTDAGSVTPCAVVALNPELLAACAFVAKPAEALPTPDAGGGDGGGGSGGGG